MLSFNFLVFLVKFFSSGTLLSIDMSKLTSSQFHSSKERGLLTNGWRTASVFWADWIRSCHVAFFSASKSLPIRGQCCKRLWAPKTNMELDRISEEEMLCGICCSQDGFHLQQKGSRLILKQNCFRHFCIQECSSPSHVVLAGR